MLQLWDRLRREPAHRLPLTLSLSRSLSHSRPLKTLTQIESVYTYCLYYILYTYFFLYLYICIFIYDCGFLRSYNSWKSSYIDSLCVRNVYVLVEKNCLPKGPFLVCCIGTNKFVALFACYRMLDVAKVSNEVVLFQMCLCVWLRLFACWQIKRCPLRSTLLA